MWYNLREYIKHRHAGPKGSQCIGMNTMMTKIVVSQIIYSQFCSSCVQLLGLYEVACLKWRQMPQTSNKDQAHGASTPIINCKDLNQLMGALLLCSFESPTQNRVPFIKVISQLKKSPTPNQQSINGWLQNLKL